MKKAQFWYADFLLGLLILFFITYIFSRVIIDLNTREDKIQELVNDATSIANSFTSTGYLSYNEWFNRQGRIGFVENGKVINEKLEDFERMLNNNGYEISQFLLGTSNNYIIYFEDKNTNIVENKVYGKFNNINELNELEVENLIRITRFVYYDNNEDNLGELVRMNILVWSSL
ncbi:MAG: hypothetical protein AABX55_02150 [Nanoarchaeota archaeon]